MKKSNRKRRPTMLMYGTIILLFSVGAYMLSSLYLKQYNNQLAFQVQTAERRIQVLATEKEALKVEIDNLASKSIVVDLASEDDMKVNKDSIVYISGKDE